MLKMGTLGFFVIRFINFNFQLHQKRILSLLTFEVCTMTDSVYTNRCTVHFNLFWKVFVVRKDLILFTFRKSVLLLFPICFKIPNFSVPVCCMSTYRELYLWTVATSRIDVNVRVCASMIPTQNS